MMLVSGISTCLRKLKVAYPSLNDLAGAADRPFGARTFAFLNCENNGT
jgi:hypothetical protein